MHVRRAILVAWSAGIVACSSGATDATPVTVVHSNPDTATVAGTPFTFDATRNQTAFDGSDLTYTVTFAPDPNGLTAQAGIISGTPTGAATTMITVLARSAGGGSATNSFTVVAFAAGLATPTLPSPAFDYTDAANALPAHFTALVAPGGSVAATDNTPPGNAVTNAGAALGRVLFYDPRLSANDRVACASCHQQQHGFSDTARFSHGFLGGLTPRHSMGLANARYYQRGRFFWDERATTLEAQALIPIQNSVEMGMTLDGVLAKLRLTAYYPGLFQAAFGTTEITSDRVSRALAQFERAMVSYRSKYDRAFTNGVPDFSAFTPDEMLGVQLFMPVPGSQVQTVGCDRCHATAAQVGDNIHNNGLDAVSSDTGAGHGRFKAPSLRNVGTRLSFMHDGRFTTLRQVVEHYNIGVQAGADVDQRLRNPDGTPHRLNLSIAQMDAIVAFLNTLTDSTFIVDPRFSSPFRP